MTIWNHFVAHPQQLLFRKALFQIHLWVGLGLGLYVLVIGITGAVLVFHDELQQGFDGPAHRVASGTGPPADLLVVAETMRAANPGWILTSIENPTSENPAIVGFLRRGDGFRAVEADPGSGSIVAARSPDGGFVRWMELLHFNLLAGPTGRVVNGVGALFLLALCLTGMIIWWPGRKNWRRSTKIDFARRWKRVNWDLHSATGFWTVSVLAMWAVTGAYFAWPDEFRSAIDRVSKVSSANIPAPDPQSNSKLPRPDVRQLLAQASERSPGAELFAIGFPQDEKSQIRIFMSRKQPLGFENSDYHYFDPFTGKHLAVWRRGLNPSLGDQIIAWIGPLHFGTFGGDGKAGIAVKILWLVLGLAPAVLMVSGSLMYWNRYLGKRWPRHKAKADDLQIGGAWTSGPFPDASERSQAD